MYAFIDDSGDPGYKFGLGSSDFLVIAGCFFDSAESAEKTATNIERFFADLGWPTNQEFKFSKTHKSIRTDFLRLIADEDFFVRALAIDKRRFMSLGPEQKDENLLRFAVSNLIKSSSSVLENTNFRIDGNAPKKVRDIYRKTITETLSNSSASLKKLRFTDSKSDRLIQLADAVVGSVRKHFEQTHPADSEYLRLLRPVTSRPQSNVQLLP